MSPSVFFLFFFFGGKTGSQWWKVRIFKGASVRTKEHFLKKNKYCFTITDRGINNTSIWGPYVLFFYMPFSTSLKKRPHVKVHKCISVHVKWGVEGLGVLVHLLMVPQVGLAGKALVAQQAGKRLLFGVYPSVTYELSGHPERLPTLQALVALGLCVNPSVVLQGHQVGELLLAHWAEEGARLVAVLVVEEGAGVTVSTPTVLADVALLLCRRSVVVLLWIRNASWNMGQRWWNFTVHPSHSHGLTDSWVPAEVVIYSVILVLLVVVLSHVVHVMVLLIVGCVGKALLAQAADHNLVLWVHLHVAL